ncbi:MAG: galactokinase [Elusimicrobiota bacterium]
MTAARTARREAMADEFRKRYGNAGPRFFRAPGRVNLIGEHTDYNDGFVMPAAIDRDAWVAAAPRPDRKVRIYSADVREEAVFDLDEAGKRAERRWSDYAVGVAEALSRSGAKLRGADLLLQSDVPLGSGLSSSAAMEVAVALALLGVSGLEVPPEKLALLCQEAENTFVGMRCGIMDQFISCCGSGAHALLLDCRTLEHRLLPLPPGARLVICNTMVKHSLAAGEYNSRREECEQGVRLLAGTLPGVRALRDVDLPSLEARRAELPETVFRRCRHVVSENARTLEAAKALERGDLAAFGRLMARSHASLRDDYQVSCSELDTMVELAAGVDGVWGARMTGGGFGGCTVNLVAEERVEAFRAAVSRGYEKAAGRRPDIYVCSAADGAGPLSAAVPGTEGVHA